MDNDKNTPDNPQSADQTSPAAPADPNAETRAYPEAAPHDTAPPSPAAQEAAPAGRSRKRRNLLIGAGAAVALLAVGGGAFAVGAEVGEEDDDRPGLHAAPAVDDRADDDHDHDDNAREDDNDDEDRDDDRSGASDAVGTLPASDAASLRAAAEKAIAAADAEGAVSIDVERGGYEVEVRLPDGTEPDVFVTSGGSTEVRTEDDTETDADPLLDLAELDAIISAALTAAEADGAGTVEAVSASDDTGVAFEVSVRLADGADVDVDLDADLAAVRVDLDD